jgi:hypothetical protein
VNTGYGLVNPENSYEELNVVRPDNTTVMVRVQADDVRDRTPLTTEEMVKFASVFTY